MRSERSWAIIKSADMRVRKCVSPCRSMVALSATHSPNLMLRMRAMHVCAQRALVHRRKLTHVTHAGACFAGVKGSCGVGITSASSHLRSVKKTSFSLRAVSTAMRMCSVNPSGRSPACGGHPV
jgi:hypothetical protein